MKKRPTFATAILVSLGPDDECIVGDLLEEYEAGRSRWWFWRQALSAIVAGAILQIRARPARALAAVMIGWTSLLLVFAILGDRVANGLAGLLWNWDRQTAYASDVWWPFAICAAMVSYTGFAVSAWVVSRFARPAAGPMLLAYTASVVVVLAGSALLIEILTRLNGRVPVPHPLFYIVSVTLPHHWRSGFFLVPLVMLLCGTAVGQRPRLS